MFILCTLAASNASAQNDPPREGGSSDSDPKAADGKPADPGKLEEARQRYQRGVQLYDEGNYEAARVEFERAYELAPSYKILYNIGLAYAQLGDYVQAHATLQQYLDLGGKELSPERRTEVAKELDQIRPRIGRVIVRIFVPGAELLVDDLCGTEASSGTVMCGPVLKESREILVNPGRRRLTVKREGYIPASQTITVAGSDRIEVNFDLKPVPKVEVTDRRNPFVLPAYVGWGVTAATAIGAGVFGYLSLKAEDDQEALLKDFGASQSALSDAREKTQTLSGITDVLLLTAVVAGGVSSYFTIRALTFEKPPSQTGKAPPLGARSVRVGVLPGGLFAGGQFD